jgi:2-dehydro-3-deoxyphosphogluconate aldolase/(4S)-4-hydroxy-2-oxoglutarate aldolase
MTRTETSLADALTQVPVVAVLRGLAPDEACALATAAIEGGLRAIEITMDSPGAAESISRLAATAAPGVAIGAGTVVTPADLDAATEAGAAFAVAPHLDLALLATAVTRRLPMVPGVTTPSELHAAVAAGAAFVKLFPAGALGVGYLSALRGPYPSVPLMASGGISVEQIGQWLAAGATAVGIGQSGLAAQPEAMRSRAASAVAASRAATLKM